MPGILRPKYMMTVALRWVWDDTLARIVIEIEEKEALTEDRRWRPATKTDMNFISERPGDSKWPSA